MSLFLVPSDALTLLDFWFLGTHLFRGDSSMIVSRSRPSAPFRKPWLEDTNEDMSP